MLSRWPLISARGRQQLEVDDMMNPQFLLSDTSRPLLLSDISRPVFANMETLIEKVFGKKILQRAKYRWFQTLGFISRLIGLGGGER